MYNERKTKGTSTLTGFMALSIIVQAAGFYSLTSALNEIEVNNNMKSKNSSITYSAENLAKSSNITNTYYEVPMEIPIETLDIPTCNTEFKTYMDYRCITDKTSDQYELQQFAWTDGHTPTGVCVEIARSQAYGAWWRVTPSRVCTENYDNFQIADLHPLRPKYKAKANHNHILINKNSAETFASAPSIIP